MGVYLTQKLVLSSPIERQYLSIQKHVSFYWVEISPGRFVWSGPTLLTGGPYLKNEEQHFEYSQEVRTLNPACVKAQEEVQNVWLFSLNT
jgi:hypothetical protein